MAFASFDRRSRPAPVADINLVPLIDVLLVLLVVLLVSAPIVTSAVRVDLPRIAAAPPLPPERVTVRIDRDGALHWQDLLIERQDLRPRLAEAAARHPPPVLAIEADASVSYRQLADLMGEASAAGLTRIGFVGLTAPLQNSNPVSTPSPASSR